MLAAGTIGITGVLGRRLSGPRVGLLAALVIAIAPLALRVSTALRNDEALVLLVIATVYAAVTLYRSDRPFSALLVGSLAGAATAVKYSGVFALIPALAVVGFPDWRKDWSKRLGLTLLGFGATLAITNHFLWTDLPNFTRQLADPVTITGPGHWAATENPAWVHTTTLGGQGTGWPLLILAVAFSVYGLAARRLLVWLFLAFPLSYLWFMTQTPSQFPRWVYPLLPFVAIAGSSALFSLVNALEGWWGRRQQRSQVALRFASALLVVLVLGPVLRTVTVGFSRRLTAPTHRLVETWLQEQASPSDLVLLPDGWLDLAGSDLRLHRVPDLTPVLSGGLHQLYAHDWIVVPETDFAKVNPRRLVLARSFLLDPTFGGNQGFDFRVYATPSLPPTRATVDFQLGEDDSWRFLGLEWNADDTGEPGLPLPANGATLFLPPLVHDEILIELDLFHEGGWPETQELPIFLEFEGERIGLAGLAADGTRIRLLSEPVSRKDLGSRISEIRLVPALEDGPIRVVRFLIRS